MASPYYRLPSLTALSAFEAAARCRSVHRAADELNVTPGAVSRQVKALEAEIGATLFVRTPTGLILTADAEVLYTVISQMFGRTAEVVERIRSGTHTRRVTLACTHAFASQWLMPRMGDFWRRYPDIQVDHLISDDAREFRRAEVDLRIRYGLGAWPDEVSALLATDTLYPISSPDFAREHPGCSPLDLPDLPLLHVDWVPAEWTGWDEFLHRAGIPHGTLSGRRFSTLGVVLRACEESQGIALGWHQLVKPLIEQQRIVPFTDVRIDAPGSYYVSWNDTGNISGAVPIFRDWLLERAACDALMPGGC